MPTTFNSTAAILRRYDHCVNVIIDIIVSCRGKLPDPITSEYADVVKATQHVLAGNAGDLVTYLSNTTNPVEGNHQLQATKHAAHQWRLLHRLATAMRVLDDHYYECLPPEFHRLYHSTSCKLFEYTKEPVNVLAVMGMSDLDTAVQALSIVATSPRVSDQAHAEYQQQIKPFQTIED
jgi:hypothetical protein